MTLKERIEKLLNNHRISPGKLSHTLIEFIDGQGLMDECMEHICSDFNVVEETDEDSEEEENDDFGEDGEGKDD